MPPAVGDTAPDFTALYCDGETFREREAHDRFKDGGVLVFAGFAFNAINENWWKQYARAGWDEFDVPVVPVVRDGPYAVNAFLRDIEVPFDAIADVEGAAAESYDLLVEREGMAGVRTARRSVFVVDAAGEIQYRWLADDWISPVPREEIEDAVAELP
ncbi:MAG: redoxin domain-containing protein [Halobacteriales archaeon]|nr:redoxin domain-containing protein [Halobacteriales archaeon]